jgi:hypothetical protein
MKTRRDVEAPLTAADVRKILGICSSRGLLVGGQALAFWADYLQVRRPQNLVSGVTVDADFIGDAELAKELGARLGWETWIPALDDATPQTGKVTHTLRDGSIKQVDFLSGVVGLNTKDIVRRAVEVAIPGVGKVRVIHPVDVLDSRIQNLHVLAAKRNAAGIAQARLAVGVVRSFVQQFIVDHGERAALKLLERIVELTTDIAAVHVFLLYGIDPLGAIPVEEFRTTSALHKRRWPQIVAAVNKQRGAARKLVQKRKR